MTPAKVAEETDQHESVFHPCHRNPKGSSEFFTFSQGLLERATFEAVCNVFAKEKKCC